MSRGLLYKVLARRITSCFTSLTITFVLYRAVGVTVMAGVSC